MTAEWVGTGMSRMSYLDHQEKNNRAPPVARVRHARGAKYDRVADRREAGVCRISRGVAMTTLGCVGV